MWTPSTLLLVLLAPAAVTLYFLWTFLMLVLRQARSPLRHLPGPPSPSFFMGNLREMHDQENNGLVARWTAEYGSTFVYRGFVGGCRLMTVDPLAVNYIMSRGYEYPKPDFVRDALASMAAGYEGLLTAEGEMHRKQVRRRRPRQHLRGMYALYAGSHALVPTHATCRPVFTAENIGECSTSGHFFPPFAFPELCVPVVASSFMGAPYGPAARSTARS